MSLIIGPTGTPPTPASPGPAAPAPHATGWRRLYPFESHYADLGGYRCHYLDEGVGEPLLLVHGNPTWSFYWRNLVLAWRARQRVIAPDHVGCGFSDRPVAYDFRLATRIADLRRFIERLDLRGITLVAHDWGGAIGLGAAAAEPERFSRIVLLNTGAFRAPTMPWRIRVCRSPLLGRLAVQGLNAFARAALWMAVADRRRLSAEARAGLLAPYDSWSRREAIWRFVMDIPMSPTHPSYGALCEVEKGLARLADKPVQLIWGMRDWCFTPWYLERFRQFFPRAEAVGFDDCGHYVVEEAHERIAPLVESFIERHPAMPARP